MAQQRIQDEGQGLLSDEEIRRRMMADPETRGRAENLAKRVRDGEAPSGSSLNTEELANFLRDRS